MDSVSELKIIELVKSEPRFTKEAYSFVTDAVSFTVGRLSSHRHVSARELLEGMRDYADKEYGVLAREVLDSWGIRSASDIGDLVYLLIGAELLSASPGDRRSDFDIDFDPAPDAAETAMPALAFSLPKID